MFKFPQRPIHEAPIAGVLPWVQWFTQIVNYFKVEAPTAPTLNGTWANFGGSYQTVEYWKDNATGMVHIQGLIKNSGAPAAGSVIFTLPEGYRPPATMLFTVGTATTSISRTMGRCDINSAGQVTYQTGYYAYYFELNGISFRTYE